MNKKEQLILELMTKFEDIRMFWNSDWLLQRKTKVWEILLDTLPEDNEWDVVERKKEKVIWRDSFWIDNCICWCTLSENYTYCPICWKKIKRID